MWQKEIAHGPELLLSWVITLIALQSSAARPVLKSREEFLSGSSLREWFVKSISVPIMSKINSGASKTFRLGSSPKSHRGAGGIKMYSNWYKWLGISWAFFSCQRIELTYIFPRFLTVINAWVLIQTNKWPFFTVDLVSPESKGTLFFLPFARKQTCWPFYLWIHIKLHLQSFSSGKARKHTPKKKEKQPTGFWLAGFLLLCGLLKYVNINTLKNRCSKAFLCGFQVHSWHINAKTWAFLSLLLGKGGSLHIKPVPNVQLCSLFCSPRL